MRRVTLPLFAPQALWKSIIVAYVSTLIVIGIAWPQPDSLLQGWGRIILSPSILISDYMVIGGPGSAFVNAGVVGLIGLVLLTVTQTAISGPTIAAVFTMSGFALFGKNPFNILPLILGVYIYSRVKNEPFKAYIVVAMFGTALGPFVSQAIFGFGMPVISGYLIGMVVGFLLPPLAPHLLHNHQGLSLYNLGFTAGIIGTIGLGLLKGFGFTPEPLLLWSVIHSDVLFTVFFVYFASMIVLGIYLKGTWDGVKEIFKLNGALVTDFTLQAGFANTIINMGLVGFVGMGYIRLVGGVLNGPSMGAVLTMVGFAAFGKHPKNIIPIMVGVWLACQIKLPQPSEPGPLLAALFGTTLAPIAGNFGPLVGVAAGFVHLATALHVGVMHGGLSLYNNGLAGGLVATLVVALARSFFNKR